MLAVPVSAAHPVTTNWGCASPARRGQPRPPVQRHGRLSVQAAAYADGSTASSASASTTARPESTQAAPHSQRSSSTHSSSTLNQRIAAASLAQQRRLLQQLVEAQQEIRRRRQQQQQQEAQRQREAQHAQQVWQQQQAQRQQDAWQQQAQQWAAASNARAYATAGVAAHTPAGEPAFASAGGRQPFNASASHHSHHHQQRRQQQQHSSMHRQHHRQYEVPVDVDDCWGRGANNSSSHSSQSAPGAGGASGPGHTGAGGAGPRGPQRKSAGRSGTAAEDAWWQEFARETAGGFRYQTYGNSTQRQYQQQQHAGDGGRASGAAGGAPAGWSAAPPSSASLSSIEQEVRAELTSLLQQSGGDLVRFVAALGIPFEQGASRRSSLRNARAAALLRLHPDKLLRQGPRQQAFGLHATQMVNELWRASGSR